MYKDGLNGRCDSGCGGHLCFEPLMQTGLLKLTSRAAVFPHATVMGRGWVLQCWFLQGVPESGSFSGLPHAALGRGVDTATLFTWDVAARLGTLNTIIPSLSDVA